MTDGQSECCQWNGPFERKKNPMTEYDEPIESLAILPTIFFRRLHANGITTIQQAKEWLKDPKGTALSMDQIESLRKCIYLWENPE